MFGTDENSLALLGQWRQAKTLRDPDQVKQMAESKGLQFLAAMTLDAPMYHVRGNGKRIFYGSLADAAQFVADYSLLQPYPAFEEPSRAKRGNP